ncbi:amidase [Virgibacillus soli]|uniref:amidase n=1 Tax=Paracerasibacillus soli TaxID=480284 RepID=UPI0035E65045
MKVANLPFQINDIIEMDATRIAKEIRANNLTSVAATTAYIEHIQKVNPHIHALVEERFELALQEAKDKDEERAITEDTPLYGVPISIKESFHVKGMKTTGGLVNRKDLIQNTDADVVKLLKKAGAIILGKTNTPALCFCQETNNKLYGRTNNPYDVNRTAGGSSGGEGALLSVGGAAVGLGSDIGGSIRFPSHFNGVVGFKPGKFQVSHQGHFPPTTVPLQERMLGIGPIGKSVRDIELIYKLIAQKVPKQQSLTSYTFEFLPNDIPLPLHNVTKKMLYQVKNMLATSFTVKDNIPPFMDETAEIWQEIMSIDVNTIQRMALSHDKTTTLLKEFTKEKLYQNSQTHAYLLWALIGAKLFSPSSKRIHDITAYLKNGDEYIDAYLARRILVFPVYHSSAPLHGKVYEEIFSIKKTFKQYMPFVAYANVWGLPSLTLPVGSDENGMPIGIQLMSRVGNEQALFDIGKKIEKSLYRYQICTVSH